MEARTIPAARFATHEPVRVTYRGALQGSFRYLFGPDVSLDGGGCSLESPEGCGQLFVRASLCVDEETGAVQVGDPTPQDFSLPGQ